MVATAATRGLPWARSWLCCVGFAAVATCASALAAQAPAANVAVDNVEGRARHLEERLHAPCCRDRPLEDHDSAPAQQMKVEIRTRFRSGQSELEIEREFRQRYGDDIVSVPLDHDPRSTLSTALVLLLLASAIGLLLLGRRWRRHSLAAAGSELSATPDLPGNATLNAQLDRELDKLDR